MFRAIAIAAVLLIPFLPASLASEEDPSLPAWLTSRLAAEGIEVDAANVRVLRTVVAGGQTLRFEVPLGALPANDPFEAPAVVPPQAPDLLVGQLTQHIMFQIGGCEGYGLQQAASGVSLVQDASWDIGLHFALGPAAGGVAASTSGDPATNLVLILGDDTGMALAAGDLAVTEDRIVIFGQCIVLLGTMTGTGAWDFR